jgi:Leucine-rich repeat (LRR) protein
MSTSDPEILRQIETKIGRSVRSEMEEDRCVALALTSEDYLYHGLIRHHTTAVKQKILQLICRLRELKRLDLRRNKVGQLPSEFSALTQLEHLNLGSNYLGGVPEQLRALQQLKFLHLGNNDIVEIPNFVGDFANLEVLALHKNVRLKSIAALAPLKQLCALNLYTINLHRLPEFVFEFADLQTLTVWNVTEFPDDLSRLRNLQFFTNCGALGLRSLPKGFTRLKKLRMSRLFQNSLETLPEDIGELGNLEQLSLYQNQLSSLPDSFANLQRLTKLNLGWNRFETVPRCLSRLRSLEWVGLFENPIQEPDAVPFGTQTRVLRYWPFSTIPGTAN